MGKDWGIIGATIYKHGVLENEAKSYQAIESLSTIDALYEEVRKYLDGLKFNIEMKYAERKRLKKEAKARQKEQEAQKQDQDTESETTSDQGEVEEETDAAPLPEEGSADNSDVEAQAPSSEETSLQENDAAEQATPSTPVTDTTEGKKNIKEGTIDMDAEQQRLVDELFDDETEADGKETKEDTDAEQPASKGQENSAGSEENTKPDADGEENHEVQQENTTEESSEHEVDELDVKEPQNSDEDESDMREEEQDLDESEPNSDEMVSEDEGREVRELETDTTEELQDANDDDQDDEDDQVDADGDDLQEDTENDITGREILAETLDGGPERDEGSSDSDVDEDDSEGQFIEDQSKNNEVYGMDDEAKIEEEPEDSAEDVAQNAGPIDEEADVLQEGDLEGSGDTVEDADNDISHHTKASERTRVHNVQRHKISRVSEPLDSQTSFLDELAFQEDGQEDPRVTELGNDFLTYHQMVNKYNYLSRIRDNEKISQFAENGNKESDLTQTYNEVRVTNLAKDPDWLKKYNEWKSRFDGKSDKKGGDRVNAVDF